MKFFYIFMLVCFAAGFSWTANARGADGSWLAALVPALAGGGTALYYQLTRGNIWGNPRA